MTPRDSLFDQRRPLRFPIAELLGRAEELAACRALLLRDDVALVTLTGFGGVGKTTLATRLAQDLAEHFERRAFFVPLATVREPSLVPHVLAEALGLTIRGDVVRAVLDALRDVHALLVLDNFEQVLDAADFVAELLVEAPSVKVLVTSRAPLQLGGEHEVPVGPLALPSRREREHSDALAEVPSVRLFMRRVEAIRPDFEWTDDEIRRAADVVTRVGGWPLGIELAAARVRVLSLSALVEALDEPLRLLTRGPRDLPERQRTLRATMDWSHALLGEKEAALLARLGVLEGSFTASDVRALFGSDALDALSALVEQGWALSEAGEPRFSLLEAVREYALERLDVSGLAEATRETHARFFLSGLEAAFAAGDPRADRDTYVRWVRARYDDLREALSWAVDSNRIDLAVRFERGLYQYWNMHGASIGEGRVWVELLLSRADDMDARTRAHLHNVSGNFALLRGDLSAARRDHERALVFARQVADHTTEAHTLMLLAYVEGRSGRDDLAEARAHEALDLYVALGDALGVTTSRHALGHTLEHQARVAEAARLYEDVLERARTLHHDGALLVDALCANGRVATRLGHFEQASAWLREAFTLASNTASPLLVAQVSNELGVWHLTRGDLDAASEQFAEGLRFARQAGVLSLVGALLEGQANVAHRRGQERSARDLLKEALAAYRDRVSPSRFQQAEATLRAWEEPQEPRAASEAQGRHVLTDLTSRERDVARLVAEGLSNAEIARELGVSVPTVNAHLRAIFSKLGVTTRVMVARRAIELGWLDG
ncbi:LuxR C-terminal-related transcriptional regulator [Deinococcus yavapaiensis]|uniref:Putative ATPase n=1 Tax=Deinococcus yavapaiensis KR-236 TaxID=694435 RepID=A0A318S543_9DEIO|nr:LuxR C-terminal-related transcriptional regulator [Deinococcus yavapaiensis]PYE52725.1 putative ATPase [Deinococcus yavapaiensis KR-236]